jgi:hypothetical protein
VEAYHATADFFARKLQRLSSAQTTHSVLTGASQPN